MSAVLDPRPARDYIAEHGWTQRQMYAGRAACLTGGLLKACQPGDAHLLVQVYRHWNLAEDWNDEDGRTRDEVLAVLDRDVTADDLAAVFGPQWEPIVALVRRAAVLTEGEAKRLVTARIAAWDAAWDAARVAARGAAWGAAWDAARGAASDAALALVVRDLIGQHGFTQEHYDTLTAPWARVIGPVHPADQAVEL